jgi:regulator of protease activity HflC (stomatin/prohibitin superfamily)
MNDSKEHIMQVAPITTPMPSRASRWLGLCAGALSLLTGCASQTLEPGHFGLRFDPNDGGLKHEVLKPGRHGLGWCFIRDCGRLDDFDITFSTRHEGIHSTSVEGLGMDLRLSVIFRPVVTELYELDSEVGPNYYEEVVGPEFRSAARGVFARHSYTELAVKNEKIEDEIEQEVRRRIKGKHVEVASITLEAIDYAPEIANAVRARIVGEQEAVRQKAALENDALKQKLLAEQETARTQMKIQSSSAEAKLSSELELLKKKNDRAVAEEDALLEKAKAEATVAHAKAEAQSITILAKAHADEFRAQTQAVSPLSVQLAAYEALGKLGGKGTTIMLGDFSRAPQFLFPRNFPMLGVPMPEPHAAAEAAEPAPVQKTSFRFTSANGGAMKRPGGGGAVTPHSVQ